MDDTGSLAKHRTLIGVILSVTVGLALWLVPLPGDIPPDGQTALAITIFAVLPVGPLGLEELLVVHHRAFLHGAQLLPDGIEA